MKNNPFRDMRTSNFGLTEEQRLYPFKTQEEQDAAVRDAIDLISPFFGRPGMSSFQYLGRIIGIQNAISFYEDMKQVVLKRLSKAFGVVIEGINKEELLNIAGEAAAKTFAAKLGEKYGIDCPIENFYADDIGDQFSDWISELINDAVKKKTGYDEDLVTAILPPNEIPDQLDAYLVGFLKYKLNVNITGVLHNKDLKTEVMSELKKVLMEELTIKFEVVKKKLKDELIGAGSIALSQSDAQLRSLLIDKIIELTLRELIKVNGIASLVTLANLESYAAKFKKRTANREKMQRYRKTHKEVRHWELKTP